MARSLYLWLLLLLVVGCDSTERVIEIPVIHTSGESNVASKTERASSVFVAENPPTEFVERVVDDGSCIDLETHFLERLNPAVIEPVCSKCHHNQGIAARSQFIVEAASGHGDSIDRNVATLQMLALEKDVRYEDRSPLVLKPLNVLAHGGGQQMEVGSDIHRLLTEFIGIARHPVDCEEDELPDEIPYLADLVPLSPDALLTKITMRLSNRQPTAEERERVSSDESALRSILGEVMQEENFYDRLKERFNDHFLIDGLLNTNPAVALHRDRYPDRYWYNTIPAGAERNFARDATWWGLARAPIELMASIVREERPFSEIVTADHMMVNPYSARSYGVFESLSFVDPTDADEFVPLRLSSPPNFEGPVFPHAGMLTSSMFLNRYQTSSTNRNRHRARMVFSLFLDTDVLEIAPRPSDPTEVADYFNPVRDSGQCHVCHNIVDPVAGLFQNFNIPGWRSPYPGNGWYRDLATPGFESAFLGLTEMPTALQWLGQVIATDPRFEMSTVRLAYQVVVGGRGLDQPTDVDDPAFVEDLAAFRAQRERFQEYAQVLVESDFNFKALIEAIVFSPYFTTQSRREGVPEERYASFYTRRLMTPEEMSRKIGSLFGAVWDKDGQDLLRDKDDYLFLYGGIDSTAVVERTTSPTSTIAAVAATFAHDLACRHVAADFTLPASERRLFPFAIGGSEEAVRANLVYLHRFLLGELVDDESAEIDIALRLYNDVLSEGQKGLAEGRYTLDLDADCQAGPLRSDPTYEARAWSAVLTYLLQTQEFLYH